MRAAWIFWSRNYTPFLPQMRTLDERGDFFISHLTLTGYPQLLEARAPDIEQALAGAEEAARRWGPERLIWRYDTIVICEATPAEYHVENFKRLAQRFEGLTQQCFISFLHPYKKVLRRLEKAEVAGWRLPGRNEKLPLQTRPGDYP